MAMTRLRWGLGGALVLLSLVSAARSLSAYLSHRLWLGSAAVLLLAVIAVVGFVSLLAARRRVERELLGLAGTPPSGELWTARRARLEEIRASGALYDRDAVAMVTEADERGRAYLGRYLVAVTVMVGLVGTFAGLMETLRGVAPLLNESQTSTLQLLLVPLGGLDVTFGASIVGILVTLALALVQGDLVLNEEQLLGRLEERTVHLLVPSLWPPAEQAMERAARELAALRGDFASLRGDFGRALGEAGRALGEAGDATVARVAKVASSEVGRLVDQVAKTLDATAARFEASARAQVQSLETSGARLTSALTAGQKEFSASLSALGAAQAESTRAHGESLSANTGRLTSALAESHRLAATEVGRLVDQVAKTLDATSARFEASARAQVQSLETSGARLTSALTAGQKEFSASLSALGAAQAESTRAHGESLSANTDRLTSALTESHRLAATEVGRLVQSLETSGAQLASALSESHELAAATLRASVEEMRGALLAATNAANQSIAASTGAVNQSMAAAATSADQSLAAASAATSQALAAAAAAASEAIVAATAGAGAELSSAGTQLAQSTVELRAAVDTLAPQLATLAPELQALAREVALLAARSASADDGLLAEELVRIGENVERLRDLLQLGQKEPRA
jgi:hypothetical protein